MKKMSHPFTIWSTFLHVYQVYNVFSVLNFSNNHWSSYFSRLLRFNLIIFLLIWCPLFNSPLVLFYQITVSNSNPDIVMVGFRVHVGNTSANHIPSEITIFQRVIKLDEGMRSWYDVPFTVAESLLADEEYTISIGPTFNGSTLPRIDSLEVYGRAKDEFGWKEKMDAVLDMEARVLGCNSSAAGSRKKCRTMQSAPVQEQVVADGLKLLSRFYALCRSQGCSKVDDVMLELSKLKCKQLLETIFESDKEPLLQAAACRVLQAVFPKRETYLQVITCSYIYLFYVLNHSVSLSITFTFVPSYVYLYTSFLGKGHFASSWSGEIH